MLTWLKLYTPFISFTVLVGLVLVLVCRKSNMEDSTSEMPVGTMTWRVRIGMFSFNKFQPNRHYMYSFQTIALRSLAFLMFYCYFFIFLSLIVIPITILIMFTINYVMPIILPNITTNNCNLNLFVCFSMVYTHVKLSLIVMYSLTRLSTVNVYELVRFKISSVVHDGHNITPSAIFLASRYALFFLLVFSCFDYYCNIFSCILN